MHIGKLQLEGSSPKAAISQYALKQGRNSMLSALGFSFSLWMFLSQYPLHSLALDWDFGKIYHFGIHFLVLFFEVLPL